MIAAPTYESSVASASTFDVVVLSDRDALSALAPELDRLATDAIEPNVFYESWMLAAALELLPSDGVRIVVVRHTTYGVTGVFPFQLKSRFRGLPMCVFESWRHPYCFLCTPLVSRQHAGTTMQAFFAWLESREAPAKVIELDLVAGDGPFWDLLRGELQARPKWKTRVSSYERAVFDPAVDMRSAVSGRHLKELRRLERRLAQESGCTYRVLRSDESIQPWIDAFLALEARGWKGREGTALASHENTRRYFTRIAADAMRRAQIQMMAIDVDGAAIAMKCNFLSKDSAFAFKIAYDEAFSKYSPGVLLELFNMRTLIESGTSLRRMDSCALPDHFMINRLWTGRRTMTTCLMANRGPALVLLKRWTQLRRVKRSVSQWRAERA